VGANTPPKIIITTYPAREEGEEAFTKFREKKEGISLTQEGRKKKIQLSLEEKVPSPEERKKAAGMIYLHKRKTAQIHAKTHESWRPTFFSSEGERIPKGRGEKGIIFTGSLSLHG